MAEPTIDSVTWSWDPEGREALVERLAGDLFRWNSPNDPYFVINGRSEDRDDEDPYAPIVRAVLDSLIRGV